MNMTFSRPLTAGDFVKNRQAPEFAGVKRLLLNALNRPKSIEALTQELQTERQMLLSSIRSNPQDFVERGGLVHKLK